MNYFRIYVMYINFIAVRTEVQAVVVRKVHVNIAVRRSAVVSYYTGQLA